MKSGAAAEAQVAAKAYYKRMHAYLNSSPTFNAQQVELILQRFKVLTTSYISQLSLEDIDALARKMQAE